MRPARVEDVGRVADRRLAYPVVFQHRVDRHPHVLHPVERVEDAEDVDARRAAGRVMNAHHVVRVVRVADGVRRRSSIWNGMLGIRARSEASRSHGSSCRKRSATSKVAPPQHLQGEEVRQHARVVRRDLAPCRGCARGWRAATGARRASSCPSAAAASAASSTARSLRGRGESNTARAPSERLHAFFGIAGIAAIGHPAACAPSSPDCR